MAYTALSLLIHAPVETVFETISNPNNYAQAVPEITKVEFLTEQQTGVGTKFEQSRLMGKSESKAIMEVTELEPNNRIRLVSNMGGTRWDSLFTLNELEGKTELTLTMETATKKFLSKIFVYLIRGMIRKAILKDMEAVKTYCEKKSAQASP